MPICKKCGERFPNKLIINDRLVTLNKRSYCIVCSPYGKHNTKKLDKYIPSENGEIKCIVCGRNYIYVRGKGCTLKKCNSCMANCNKKARKAKMVALKGGKCIICGYNRCVSALDFHHRDPTTKSINISGSHCRKWSVIEEELKKCELLCCRCHVEIEAGIAELPIR